MDLLEAIKTRRTIRKFKPDPVPDEEIKIILESAIWAPNAGNMQPWEFIIIRNRDTIENIRRIFKSYYQTFHLELPKDHPYRKRREERLSDGMYRRYYERASTYVAVVVDPTQTVRPLRDGAAAVENMMLAAWSLSIGAAWLDSLPDNEVKKLLNIPERYTLIACMPIGYPDEEPSSSRRLLDTFVHYEKYSVKK